jgi:hypothetical protein
MGRVNPESHGLFPDGDRKTAQVLELDHVQRHPAHLLVKVILRNSQFWILVACFSPAVMTLMAVFVHQVAYALNTHC